MFLVILIKDVILAMFVYAVYRIVQREIGVMSRKVGLAGTVIPHKNSHCSPSSIFDSSSSSSIYSISKNLKESVDTRINVQWLFCFSYIIFGFCDKENTL